MNFELEWKITIVPEQRDAVEGEREAKRELWWPINIQPSAGASESGSISVLLVEQRW
jgi:hypothetical protein